MTQHDILVRDISGQFFWVCGIFHDDLADAIKLATSEAAGLEYVSHKTYKLLNGKWEIQNGV